MNRIWIAGAGGRVGSALAKRLNTVDNELFCTDKDDVDITDIENVETYAVMNRPNIIINCARISNENICSANPDEAYKINALGARNLAVQAQRIGAKFVQMSTDDVFSGDSIGKYNEFDLPSPVSVYGKSKYAGEQLVSAMMNRFFIVRSSWIYGIGEDYVDIVCRKLENGEKVNASVNQIAVPTRADDIARVINDIIETENYGIYHVVSKGHCSRYEFACEIARIKGYPEDMIVANHGITMNTLLDGMMLRINDIEGPGYWKDVLKEYIDRTGGII